MSLQITPPLATADKRTADELHRILLELPAARRRWMRCAGRRRGGVNQAAVARVIAAHLWDIGERSDSELYLHRRLKDRVARALSGTFLSAETLTWFIGAFDLPDEVATRLWDVYADEQALRPVGGAPCAPPPSADWVSPD